MTDAGKKRVGRKAPLTHERRLWLIMLIILILLAGAAIAALSVVLSGDSSSLPVPMAWTNAEMAYSPADQSAMQTRETYSSDLCIGGNNVANSGINLRENESGALFSIDDRKVVFARDMYKQIYPASVTKIMTAILAIKYGNMKDTVTINWQDLELESGSQVVGLRIGDRVNMGVLLRGLLIHSGNDAAQAIARHIGGSQDKFVAMMNEELNNLGCTGSHFTNPTGLHDTNHYTTVYDIYLMLNEAIKYDDFVNIMQVSVYDFQYENADGEEMHVTLDSTDRYLTGQTSPPKDVTVLGGKTGTTAAAGNCLALVSQNAYGQFYISIVVGALSKDDLYEDQNMLLSQINA